MAPGCQQPSAPPRAQFVRTIPWAGRGVWLKADTHTHTKFSDGGHTIAEVVAAAERHGCDVVAITDHGDDDLRAATPEYLAALQAARQQHPRLLILGGLEWNVPPWGGSEHATVLVPQAMLIETFLSFIGLGVQAPLASWGTLVTEGSTQVAVSPWVLAGPGLVMGATIFALNFVGDGLRDALDP